MPRLYRNKTVFRNSHPVINSSWHTKSKGNIDHLEQCNILLARPGSWHLHGCDLANQNVVVNKTKSLTIFQACYMVIQLDLELQSSNRNPTLWALCHIPWGVPEQLFRSCCTYYSAGGTGVIGMCCTVVM